MHRWRRMADEVEGRSYGSDKLISDVLQFWGDATIGWCAAVRGSGVGGGVPLVFFLVHPQQEGDSKEIDFFAPSCPQGTPEAAYLVPILDGNPAEINASNVRACLAPSRHALVIHLEKLWDGKTDLTKGVYKGLIHVGEEIVAHLIVRVADKKSFHLFDADVLHGLDDIVRASTAKTEAKPMTTAKAKAKAKPKKKTKKAPKS
jgi:hypothetical protein